jgi:outer membrane lipase/esterase
MSWREDRGRTRANAWIMGDLSWLDIENYRGFPDVEGKPRSLTVGVDYKVLPGLIIGAAVSAGTTDVDFGARPDGKPMGGFDQDEWAISIYAALKAHAWSLDVIGTWGKLDYDINRIIPMGITTREVFGSTDGDNWSLATQLGYDFKWRSITHGPIAGLVYQHVDIDGFAETPGATTPTYLALTFGEQTRTSLVSSLGWRVSWDAGVFVPFARQSGNMNSMTAIAT